MREFEVKGTIVYVNICGIDDLYFISDRERIYYVDNKKHLMDIKHSLYRRCPVLFELKNGKFKHDITINNEIYGTLRQYLELSRCLNC